MFRFFRELMSFNTKSTATKILYQIVDSSRKEVDGYTLNTDNIKNMDTLVKTLAEVISSTLDYTQYQKCHSYIKDDIKLLIVKELTKTSKTYDSVYGVTSVYSHDETIKIDKGITISYRYYPGEHYPYQAYNIPSATYANFPEKLFLDKTLLKKHIIIALQYKYPTILKIINNSISDHPVARGNNCKLSPLLYPVVEPSKKSTIQSTSRLYPDLDGYDLTPNILK